MNIIIHELMNDNTEHLETMLELYVELMPQYAQYAPVFRHKTKFPFDFDPLTFNHVWLVDIDGEAAGMIAFEYAPRRDFGLLMDLAVRPKFRKVAVGGYERLAEYLIKSAIDQLKQDAKHAGRPIPIGMGVEIEFKGITKRYEEYGMVVIPVEYHEPLNIDDNKNLVKQEELATIHYKQMQLGIFPLDRTSYDVKNDINLCEKLIYALYIDHYHVNEDDWALQWALRSLRG